MVKEGEIFTDTRGIHQDVDTPKFRHGILYEGGNRRRIGYIQSVRNWSRALHLFEVLRCKGDIGGHYHRSFIHEPLCNGLAYAAGTACNDGNLLR